MVGEVSYELRGRLGALLAALTAKDVDRIATALLDLSVSRRSVDRGSLREDLTEFVSLYQGRRIGEVDLGPLITRMLALLRTYHLQLPREVPMLFKFFLMVEGMGAQLDPQFNLGEFPSTVRSAVGLEPLLAAGFARFDGRSRRGRR
jgi:ubiquinone biosynthesis protein